MCGKQGHHKDEATVPPISHQNTRYWACWKARIQGFLSSIRLKQRCHSLRLHRGSNRGIMTNDDHSMLPSRNLAEVVPGCSSGPPSPPPPPYNQFLRPLSHQNHAEVGYSDDRT